MKKNNENKSIISTLFTDKELAELNLTPEEIEVLETAEAVSQAADIVPESEKDLDVFFEKYDATFPPSTDFEATVNKFRDLEKTDPKFFQQIVAMSALIDTVEEVPPVETEKVSLAEIEKEKAAIVGEEQKAKLAEIDAILKQLAEEDAE